MINSIDDNIVGKKEKFLRIYANLPIGVRNEIVLFLNNKGPISWSVAYNEIANNTEFGNKLLDKLQQLQII